MKRMSRIARLILASLMLIPGAKSQDRSKAGLLWEIKGKGLAQPSYLYGTMHLLCPEDFKITEALRTRFDKASKIYLEIDMDDPSMNMKMLQLSMMKGKTLKDVFTPEQYERLSKFFTDTVRMPLAPFNQMKPFTLFSLMIMKSVPCQQMESYEQRFVQMAKEQNKEVLGLERIEDQIAVFDAIPDDQEARMVMEYVDSFDTQRKEFSRMAGYYRDNKLDSLYEMIVSSPDMKGIEDVMLNNRNMKWIPVMEAAMGKGSNLFAVGAGHLVGEKGVVTLLRQKGYTVTPVN